MLARPVHARQRPESTASRWLHSQQPACTTSTAHLNQQCWNCTTVNSPSTIPHSLHSYSYTTNGEHQQKTTAARSYAQLQHKQPTTTNSARCALSYCLPAADSTGAITQCNTAAAWHTHPTTTLNATATAQTQHSLLHLCIHRLAEGITQSNTHAGVTQRWKMLQATLLLN